MSGPQSWQPSSSVSSLLGVRPCVAAFVSCHLLSSGRSKLPGATGALVHSRLQARARVTAALLLRWGSTGRAERHGVRWKRLRAGGIVAISQTRRRRHRVWAVSRRYYHKMVWRELSPSERGLRSQVGGARLLTEHPAMSCYEHVLEAQRPHVHFKWHRVRQLTISLAAGIFRGPLG